MRGISGANTVSSVTLQRVVQESGVLDYAGAMLQDVRRRGEYLRRGTV